MKKRYFAFWYLCVSLVLCAAMGPPSACAQATTPAPAMLRVATFNVEDVRTADLLTSDNPRLKQLAEVLQRIKPNIVLLNEIAYDMPGGPDVADDQTPGQNATRFVKNYLAVSQAPGLEPLHMRAFMAPTNTGIPSGFDLNHDGKIVSTFPPDPGSSQTKAGRAYGGDCWGFGTFPGQYGMALLIDEQLEFDPNAVRTFRLLPWDYMPGAFLPTDPKTGEPWYDKETLTYFRLSSKNHWDVPVTLPNGRVLHLLCSHPTPPAFDGPEMRNKKRNHDEIRFWADYLDNAAYIVDDTNTPGGIARGSAFVILGDLNADPDEGSSYKNPIQLLLAHPLIARPDDGPSDNAPDQDSPHAQDDADTSWIPMSDIPVHGLDPDDTAHFGLRVDYVLPWRNIEIVQSGIWREQPTGTQATRFPSDHFPVWADLRIPPPPQTSPRTPPRTPPTPTQKKTLR